MFGLFYMFTSAIFGTAAKIQKDARNSEARERARENGDLTYYGHNGERLVSNDKAVYRKYVNGDKVLADLYTGQIYKNFSEEKRRESENKASCKGKTVIDVHYEELQEYNRTVKKKVKSLFLQPNYRDIKTREYYIIVFINGVKFYMNVVNGEVVRMADGEDGNERWGNLSIEEIIKIINERQRILNLEDKDKHDSWWWNEHFYLQHSAGNILMITNDGTIVEGNRIRNQKIKEIYTRLKAKGEKGDG